MRSLLDIVKDILDHVDASAISDGRAQPWRVIVHHPDGVVNVGSAWVGNTQVACSLTEGLVDELRAAVREGDGWPQGVFLEPFGWATESGCYAHGPHRNGFDMMTGKGFFPLYRLPPKTTDSKGKSDPVEGASREIFARRSYLIEKKFLCPTEFTPDEAAELASIDTKLDAMEVEQLKYDMKRLERLGSMTKKAAELVQGVVPDGGEMELLRKIEDHARDVIGAEDDYWRSFKSAPHESDLSFLREDLREIDAYRSNRALLNGENPV